MIDAVASLPISASVNSVLLPLKLSKTTGLRFGLIGSGSGLTGPGIAKLVLTTMPLGGT
ncbi:hypothetical protein D3C87_2173190 [compost metagenome]